MLWAIVKNNYKLLCRDKIAPLLLCVYPIFTIAILVAALSSIMGQEVSLGDYSIGYEMAEDSLLSDAVYSYFEEAKKEGISCIPMTVEQATNALNQKEIVCFVQVQDDEVSFYETQELQRKALEFEGYFSQWIQDYKVNKTIETQREAASAFKVTSLPRRPQPNSRDYYVIAELVCIIWITMYSAIYLGGQEQTSIVRNRLLLTPVSLFQLYVGRLTVTILFSILIICVDIGICELIFHPNWGADFGCFLTLITLEILAVSIIGTSMSFLIAAKEANLSIMVLVYFVLTFFGGGNQMYLSDLLPETIKQLSPVYYVNRALVELSYLGTTSYFGISVKLLLLLCLGGGLLGCISMWVYKRRGVNV